MVVEKLMPTFNASTAKIEHQNNSFSLPVERGWRVESRSKRPNVKTSKQKSSMFKAWERGFGK